MILSNKKSEANEEAPGSAVAAGGFQEDQQAVASECATAQSSSGLITVITGSP
jgi:hypothetical protein